VLRKEQRDPTKGNKRDVNREVFHNYRGKSTSAGPKVCPRTKWTGDSMKAVKGTQKAKSSGNLNKGQANPR